MAITINVTHDFSIGATDHLVTGTFDYDSSYPTGGESFDITGQRTIEHMLLGAKAGYVSVWDQANQKVLAYTSNGASPAALAQVPNTTDLSAVTGVQFWAIVSS